ncbi:MAG: hypothetical protein ILA25_02820 [Prevotella sp.]|nr:hypothetical protein [Prevotella sp.]
MTYVNGQNIYVTDGTNNLLLYGTNSMNLKQGDNLIFNYVGKIWGQLYRYNKLPELKFSAIEDVTVQQGGTVTPKTITADKLAENINGYVKIENAEYVSASGKNLTFKVGDKGYKGLVIINGKKFVNK